MSKSTEQVVHERLVAILRDGATRLRVDTRTVKVFDHLPNDMAPLNAVPMVVVEQPEETSQERWGSGVRRVLRVSVIAGDHSGIKSEDENPDQSRVKRLLELARIELYREPNLRMPELGVFASFVRWEENPEPALSQDRTLVARQRFMVLPVIEQG